MNSLRFCNIITCEARKTGKTMIRSEKTCNLFLAKSTTFFIRQRSVKMVNENSTANLRFIEEKQIKKKIILDNLRKSCKSQYCISHSYIFFFHHE